MLASASHRLAKHTKVCTECGQDLPTPMRQVRSKSGITQLGLVKLTGVSQPTIARLEAGKAPTLEQARLIAAALKSTVQDLFPESE